MLKDRYLVSEIGKDLKKKMVFLGGPRQVGKTTFAREIIARAFHSFAYFNWDNRKDRKTIQKAEWPATAKLIILDEIHKNPKWKSLVKGEYDLHKERFSFLVTGSARLNIYKRGGDSLLGRYHYYRLHPFSYAEILKIKNTFNPGQELIFPDCKHDPNVLEKLFHFGGFPESFLEADPDFSRRWHNERKELLFREDIRDLTAIKDLASMELLCDLLPGKTGSPLSLNSLREDVEVTHKAIVNWLDALENLYYSFRIFPFQHKRTRSLKKEPKLYLWDWSEIEDEARRLENMAASHLLKFCHYLHDVHGHEAELFYLRDVDKREVDFLITHKGKPWFSVEVKMSDENVSPALNYYRTRLKIPFSFQVAKKAERDFWSGDVRVMPVATFLSGLV